MSILPALESDAKKVKKEWHDFKMRYFCMFLDQLFVLFIFYLRMYLILTYLLEPKTCLIHLKIISYYVPVVRGVMSPLPPMTINDSCNFSYCRGRVLFASTSTLLSGNM